MLMNTNISLHQDKMHLCILVCIFYGVLSTLIYVETRTLKSQESQNLEKW